MRQDCEFVMLDGWIMNTEVRFDPITGVVTIATLTHKLSTHKSDR